MNGKIEKYLKHKSIVYLDTAPIIYFIQEDPQYLAAVKEVFLRIDNGAIRAISSFLTLLELLVKPLEVQAYDLVGQYRDLLRSCLTLYPVEQIVSEKAAELRAKYRYRTPDAIQIATALSFGAQLFITNDLELKKKIHEIEVLNLSDLV